MAAVCNLRGRQLRINATSAERCSCSREQCLGRTPGPRLVLLQSYRHLTRRIVPSSVCIIAAFKKGALISSDLIISIHPRSWMMAMLAAVSSAWMASTYG